MEKEYYAAYDERYRVIHEKGISWSSQIGTPIVPEVLERYGITKDQALLEIGCGEGRDAHRLLDAGYALTATDLSPEAIAYCRRSWPQWAEHFQILDCLSDSTQKGYDFIFAVAVIHMLVRDDDRKRFYKFLRSHLKPGGKALVCTMGDGETEFQTDISQAFALQEREHPAGKIQVAATSCRMVGWDTFRKELTENGLQILETGITPSLPDFDKLMYAVVA